MSLSDLEQAFQKLKMKVDTHIGNPAAHNTVVWDYSGPENGFIDIKTARSARLVPTYISDGTDIFALDPGYYMNTGSVKNVPDEATVGVNYIEVSRQGDDENKSYGKITLYNLTTEKSFIAYKQGWNQGKWHWLRYEKKANFGGDWSSSQTNYSIYHLDTTTLFSATINANVRLGPHNYARIITGFPGSLRPDRKIYVNGMAQTADNVWESAGVIFDETGTLTIVNLSDKTITRTFAEMLFTYNEVSNVTLK